MSSMLLVLLGTAVGGLVVAAVASWAVWKYIIKPFVYAMGKK